MDPLTHTLVGASLAATRLGRTTRFATPALVLGANLPDIDVLAYARGSDFALGFRRGWTHGVPSLLLLPALLTGALLLWHRWRGGSRTDLPVSSGWLLGLSYLACLTHPSLDWLNNYGMRWWMPMRDTWYYGDSVFIIDPWLWLLLGLGWLIGRRPSKWTASTVACMATLIIWLVGSRAPAYLPIVGSILGLLLLALLWQPASGWLTTSRTATTGLLLATLYIAALLALHSVTSSRVRHELTVRGLTQVEDLLVGPTPANPLAWDVVIDTGEVYRWGRFDWLDGGTLRLSEGELPVARRSVAWPAILDSGKASGFLRWVRFPWLEIEGAGSGRRVYLMDARYTRSRTGGFGGIALTLPAP